MAETIAPQATLLGMSPARIRPPHVLTALAAMSVVLAGCAAAPASPLPTSTASTDRLPEGAPPKGRVIATGTVLDTAGDVRLCLGAIMESYPPQCEGIPVDGWTWTDLDGSETSGETIWGSYAVYGIYDGERYSITDPPILLALYDPIRPEDPTGGVEGSASDDDLARIQGELSARLEQGATVWTERGYVWAQVAWDDGTLQDAVDAAYGDGTVIVTSSMREID